MTKFCAGTPEKLRPRIASVSPSPAIGRPSAVITGAGSVVGTVTLIETLTLNVSDCTTIDVLPSPVAITEPDERHGRDRVDSAR